MNTAQFSFKSLGREGSFLAPSQTEDIERINGQRGSVVEAYYTQYAYQDRNVKMRENVSKALEEFTGVPRESKIATDKSGAPKKDDEGNEVTVYTETEQDYVNRLLTTPQSEGSTVMVLSDADFARIWNEQNELLGPWESARSVVSDRKPAKPFYDLADELLGKIAAGASTAAKVQTNLETQLACSFEQAFGEFNRDNLARALKALREKQERDRASALLG